MILPRWIHLKTSSQNTQSFNKSFSHWVLQLIIHICHLVAHKHTPRQACSLSAVWHVLHQWECWYSSFPWWRWTKQHVCCLSVSMIKRGWKNWYHVCNRHTCGFLCMTFLLLSTHTWTQRLKIHKVTVKQHTDMFLIATNSRHVRASLVSWSLSSLWGAA